MLMRLYWGVFLALTFTVAPACVAASPPEPVFAEDLALEPAAPAGLLERWIISPRLPSELRPLRVSIVTDPPGEKSVVSRSRKATPFRASAGRCAWRRITSAIMSARAPRR
jgi:hypothetical protein